MSQKVLDLKSLTEDDGRRPFDSILLLKSSQVKISKNGSEFLTLEFGDNSGTFSAMCFEGSTAFSVLRNSISGAAFEVRGVVEFYQGRFSPKIETVRKVEGSELESQIANLAAVSPYDPVAMKKELLELIGTIEDKSLRDTVTFAIGDVGDVFFTSSAAVKMHHAYVYGLLEHTLKTARMANALQPLYPFIDRDLALAGCILHDIGKVIEYTQGLATDRTRAGILQGHVVLGYRMVRRAGLKVGLNADLLERLEHIILSHQGELEWGAAARAATPEAVFVSSIDNFDAKMGAVENAVSTAGEAEFVEVGALKAKVLAKPVIHQ